MLRKLWSLKRNNVHRDKGKMTKESISMDKKAARDMTISKSQVISLGIVLLICCIVVFYGKDILPKVAFLYPEQVSGNPYFQLKHVFLLYFLTPIIVMCSITLFVLPGVFLVMVTGKISRWVEMIVLAFGISFIVYVPLISIVKLVSLSPPDSSIFLIAVITFGALSWLVLAYRVFKGAKLPSQISQTKDLRHLFWTIFIPVISLLLLLPIIFWQDMHDDGLEALEIGRSLSTYFLPHFPTPSRLSGLGGGMFPMAYPVHWFVIVFGDFEFSARLPMLLYLPVLFCLLVQLIEWKSPRRLGCIEEALIILALGVYTVTMSFNASFDPYFADIAAPATFETLTIVCILAMINFLWRGQTVWFFFFAFMSFLCRPTGLLMLGFLGVVVLFCLPQHRISWLLRIFLVIVVCVFFTIVYEKIYIPFICDSTLGFSSTSLLMRFQFIRIDDISRINFVLFPCGIIPLISLFVFRRQDALSKVITVLSVLYFFVFYFQAFVALHHFVPVMILPLVVFWRMYLHQHKMFRRISIPVVAIAGVMALWFSLPKTFTINRTVRELGEKTAFLVGDYYTNYREQVSHPELLFKLIPPDWKVKDPKSELISSPASIIYYSTRQKPQNAQINYVVQPLANQVPNGFSKIADDGIAAIYVKDVRKWFLDRYRPLQTDYRSMLYDIPRATLFRHWGSHQGQYTVDFGQIRLLKEWGMYLAGIEEPQSHDK